MKQNKIQKEIQWQHASPSKGSAIRARMLQNKMIVKIKRGLSFYKLVSLANKI